MEFVQAKKRGREDEMLKEARRESKRLLLIPLLSAHIFVLITLCGSAHPIVFRS